MEYEIKILKLSKQFLHDYPRREYSELMIKKEKPYSCLLIDTHQEYLICIPFRSNINHNNSYIFKGTNRSKKGRSGLDYSKVILIKNMHYLDDSNIVIDNDEYKMMIENIKKIIL